MKVSRQQLWPSIALLAVLACVVGYLTHALARRGPSARPVAAPRAAEPAPEATPVAAAPAAPSKDPFAVPRPPWATATSGTTAEGQPEGGESGAAAPASGGADPSSPRLVGVVVGGKTVAAIRVGERRYHVVVGDVIPELGRVALIGRDWVVIKGDSGQLRLTIEGRKQP